MERVANPKPLYPFPNRPDPRPTLGPQQRPQGLSNPNCASTARGAPATADGRRRRRAHCHHMFNLDGAHTLQAELRSLHRKPRGYVEEGADAEDLLAVEAQVQPKPARQTSLTGFFGAPLKPCLLYTSPSPRDS